MDMENSNWVCYPWYLVGLVWEIIIFITNNYNHGMVNREQGA